MKTRIALTCMTALLAASLNISSAHAASDDHAAVADSYYSLSGAMATFYADQSNQDLGSYLASQELSLTPSTVTNPFADAGLGAPDGTDPEATTTESPFGDLDLASFGSGKLTAGAGAGAPVAAKTLTDFNSQLGSAGLALDPSKYNSLDDLAGAVAKSAQTPDGAVTLAGAKWAQEMAGLRGSALTKPNASNPGQPQVSADALPFGLLMNKALTSMVLDHPNMIATAQKSGLGSAGLVDAWNSSMAKAYADSSKDLSGMLPNQCVGDMMSVMASGKSSSAKGVASGNCAKSCASAGQYLHNSSQTLFNPQLGALTSNASNPVGGVLNNASLSNMSTWAQALVYNQNSQLTAGTPLTAVTGGASSCGKAASAGAKSTAKSSLPGVFAGLKK